MSFNRLAARSNAFRCFIAAFAWSLCAASAVAQNAPPATVDAPVAVETVRDADSADAVAARGVVARAKALFAVGDFSAALAEFTRAYELLAGDARAAAVLNNIAVCHERMFRYDVALEYYARYLHEASPDAEDRAEVEAVMRSLRDLLGTLHITGNTCGEVWVDDRKLGLVPVDLLVSAGAHVLEVRAKGYEPARRELRVTARTTQHLNFELDPLPNYRGLHSAYFWTGTALTTAALVTGAAFGIAALSKHAELGDMAKRGVRVDGQPVRDCALSADIAFGTALVFGVGTTVLFFLTDWHEPTTERAPPPAALSVGFGATRRSFALAVTGAMP
jgi:tetratricopeptide (TPR) repeat protein